VSRFRQWQVSTSPEGQLGGVLGTMKPGMKLLGEANALFDQVAYDPKTKVPGRCRCWGVGGMDFEACDNVTSSCDCKKIMQIMGSKCHKQFKWQMQM